MCHVSNVYIFGPYDEHVENAQFEVLFGEVPDENRRAESAQIIINQARNNKLIEKISSDWVNFYKNGSKAFSRVFDQGVAVGVQQEFYDDSNTKPQLARLYTYNTQGQLDGEQKTFYKNGNIETQLHYTCGVLDGFKKKWDPSDKLCEEAHYVKGKLEGRYFQIDTEGREIIYHYKNSKK